MHEEAPAHDTVYEHQSVESLVRSAMPLARMIARQHQRPGLEFEDLEAEGVLGLVLAARRYDPTRGVPFTGYGRFWVKAMVIRHVEKHGIAMSLGGARSTRRLSQGLSKERRRRTIHGQDTSPQALARVFKVPEAQIEAFDRARFGPAIPLQDPGREGTNPEEVLCLDDQPSPEELCIQREQRARLSAWFDGFEPLLTHERDRTIWRERIRTDTPTTQRDLGRRYGVSKQRISQIERALLQRFREYAQQTPPPSTC